MGTVDNNSVSVKPVVLTQAGYITTERKEGASVTISASDLVSGTKSISANGTGIDVANYATVNVNVSGGGSDILPSGYEQLEYIRFSGSQYINTNITPVEGDTIKMIVLPQTDTGAIFSCGAGTYQLILLNLRYYKYFATGAAAEISPTLSANKVYEITASSTLTAKTAGSSDLTVTSTYASSIDGTSNKLWIGARVNNTSYFTGCIYSFSLTNEGTAKANFVPCVRESDGKAGMYDLVSETFFPSATSTDIEAGAPAVNVPVEADLGTKTITSNGTYNASSDSLDGYSSVSVNVSGGGGTPSLTSLTAVYTQSGTVYTTDDLSVLIPDLVVTGVFNYGLSVDIASTDYTLTGTLTEGTSTITVSYGGMTDTFTVVATAYWDYYWDYRSGTLPPDATFTTNGDATYSLTADGLAMTSTTSSYVYLRLDNYQTTTHGMLEVVGNVSNINAYNNWRVCVADGTNGAQTCMGDHYFRILNSTTGSSTERLCYANTNQDYTVRVTYYKNGSSITGSYRIDGCLLRSGYASSNVKYTTATRVWCQTMGGTLLIKQIKYRDMQ